MSSNSKLPPYAFAAEPETVAKPPAPPSQTSAPVSGLGDFLAKYFGGIAEWGAHTGIGRNRVRNKVWSHLYDLAEGKSTANVSPATARLMQRPRMQELVADKAQQWATDEHNQLHLRDLLRSQLQNHFAGVPHANR